MRNEVSQFDSAEPHPIFYKNRKKGTNKNHFDKYFFYTQ